jgi:branched-chain amino acid transport system substrate-binding protein
MDEHYPDRDRTRGATVYGYVLAQTLIEVLRQCGDALMCENIMRQAAILKLGMLLPGATINRIPTKRALP